MSTAHTVTKSVPQGSLPCLVILLICIDDMVNFSILLTPILHVDDTNSIFGFSVGNTSYTELRLI